MPAPSSGGLAPAPGATVGIVEADEGCLVVLVAPASAPPAMHALQEGVGTAG
ncbi:hypothetical protein AB0H12_38195 [Actinosynnema sp. NPDC023794]